MSDWGKDVLNRFAEQPPARPPATWGEISAAEWKANGLDTAFGVNKPFTDAYQELFDRTAEITGRKIPELARERGLNFFAGGMQGRIDTLGKIVDSLPDAEARKLADYKDVYGRARRKAADTMREAEEVRGATYGLSGWAQAFIVGAARQAVDPVNLASMPLGGGRLAAGAGKAAVARFLGMEAAAGAGTQALVEFGGLREARDQLGLENNTFENIVQAGVGQAGLSGLFLAAGAVYRRMRGRGDLPPGMPDLAPEDFEAAARTAERDARIARDIGETPEAHQKLADTQMMLDGLAAVEGAASRKAWSESPFAGTQNLIRPDGSKIAVKYEVVERRRLIASHDLDGNVNPAFPPELQPRDRTAQTSRLWVTENAARLEPELLGAAARATDGAPLIGPDGVVESGNGRVLLLDAARRDHPERAAAYRDWLEDQGFETGAMKEPVLVRRRLDEMDAAGRIDLTRESNKSPTVTYSAPERARQDARLLDDALIGQWQGGEFGASQNTGFVRAFAGQVLLPEERGAFISKSTGNLSKEGKARLEAALVQRGWQSDFVTQAITEDIGDNSLNIMRALMDTAPLAARLRSAIEEGRVPSHMNVLKPVLDAVELVHRGRASGQKLADVFDQIDIERGAVPPDVRAAAELFFKDEDLTIAASREVVAQRLQWAIGEALTHDADQLFHDGATAGSILKAAYLVTQNFDTMPRAKALTDAVAAPAAPRPQTQAEPKAAAPDPRIERARALLDEHGDDMLLKLDEGDIKPDSGTSARALLDSIDQYRKAAAEMADCVIRTGGSMARAAE